MVRVVRTKVEVEGRFEERFVAVEEDGLEAWPHDQPLRLVGRPTPRVDGYQRVTGTATYTHDVRLPGMLYARMLRSPHPHARVKRIDPRRAEALAGVRAVLTPENTPDISWFAGRSRLLERTVRFAGDEVAFVVAEDPQVAADALELVRVEYEPLPFVTNPRRALEPDAPRVFPDGNVVEGYPRLHQRGDVERGFRQAEVTVEAEFETQVALHQCLETHGSVAAWDGQELIVYDSTQNLFGVREALARKLGLPLHRVRVIKQYMGGGFGSKNNLGKYTVLAAIASRRLGRPVQALLDRREEALATGNRPSSWQRIRLGAKRDGTLTAIELESLAGVGAYGDWGGTSGPAQRLYRCANVRTADTIVRTHTGPAAAFRAPGYVEGAFALESAMDMLAEKLGLDPLELRLRNHADHDQPLDQPYSSKFLTEALRRGAEAIGWSRRDRLAQEGHLRRGMGLAAGVWWGGGGPPAYAQLKVNPDGTATLITATQDIGTGTKTALAQIAAEELGLPLDQVEVLIGDTAVGPYSPLSAGSGTLASMGPAVRGAAADARRQLLEIASQMLDRRMEDLTLEDGQVVRLSDPDERTPLTEILDPLGDVNILGKGARAPNPEDALINTFAAQFARVAVDTRTGEVRVEKLVAVNDSGRIVNPLTVSSQIEGGVLQGLGMALMEERVVDAGTGRVLTGGLEHYLLPTSLDVPPVEAEALDIPDPVSNNLGVKGIGEPPIVPTPAAVANAVAHALGARPHRLPLTRERVLELIEEARRR